MPVVPRLKSVGSWPRCERRVDDRAAQELRAAEQEDPQVELRERREKPVDLLGRVVVHEPRTHGAVVLVEPEMADRLERVVVARPDGDLARRGVLGDRARAPAVHAEAEGRHAALHRREAVERDVLRQPVEEPLPQLALVGDDRVPAERVDVVDRGDEPGEQLVLRRAELEAMADRLVRRRAHLVRAPAPQELLAPERHPHVRPEELVRRADQHVAAPGGDVDRPVRAVVDGVDPRERARRVRELDDAADVRRGADRVRGRGEGDDARLLGQLPFEIVVVEREVVRHVDEADDDPEIALELEPRGDVRVVVEPRHEHLVAGRELAREGAGEEEVERRHALAERDLTRRAAEERRGPLVGEVDERRRPLRGPVRRADVRVVVAEVVGDRVDHLVGALGPARAVEEGEPAVERREARADGVDVEQRRLAHATRHL